MPIRGRKLSPLKMSCTLPKPWTQVCVIIFTIDLEWGVPIFDRKNKTPTAFAIGVSEFNLDDDLLSHGETPHYHRRCIVSLLSSGW
ncbi:hypothetical protein, partial [Pseudomonas sp. GL-RE-29]|uniref:hypothetical protein n=1 Tax=Pseudomonas sp. GL-RE-29 TaxID=2832375 RepID=UPI001CBE8D49